MAETTTSETKRARLERELYDNIKNLIIQAIRDGGSDSAISIHSAMAHAMCDTITDIKGPYMSQVTQTFVESWSLATSHMEHKLTYFMRMLLLKNKKKGSILLSNYGAILDRLSPEQIEGVLAENEYSPDGRAVVILPKKQAKPPAKTVRYTLTPTGEKIYR